MSNLQYGDTVQLQGLGYQPSITLPPAGGYLTFDSTGNAVTTVSPVATWKFESPDGKKKGDVMVGDTVRIVGVAPKSVAGKELKCVRESIAQAHAGTGPTEDPSLTWIVYGVANATIPGGVTPQVIPAENSFLCFSSSLAGTPIPGGPQDATGEFLCIQNTSAANNIPDGLYMVQTRLYLNAGLGGDPWWKIAEAQQNSASPSPSPSLTTGNKCCFDVPEHALFTVAFTNKEKSAKTITVSITGQMPATIPVPAGHSTGSRELVAGPGTPDQGGKNLVCIQIADSQTGQMLLGWQPAVVKGDKTSIQIGAEKPDPSTGNYPPDGPFNDIVVTVSWGNSA